MNAPIPCHLPGYKAAMRCWLSSQLGKHEYLWANNSVATERRIRLRCRETEFPLSSWKAVSWVLVQTGRLRNVCPAIELRVGARAHDIPRPRVNQILFNTLPGVAPEVYVMNL
jgi:hypothetical protein